MQKSGCYEECRKCMILFDCGIVELFLKGRRQVLSKSIGRKKKMKPSRRQCSDESHWKWWKCVGLNSKAVEIWSILVILSPFGNHGDSRVTYIPSLWEGITLEILPLKNDLNLVVTHESWGGAFCQHSSEPEKPVSVWLLELPPLLGNGTVTAEWKKKIILKSFPNSCMCPRTLQCYFHHRYFLDILTFWTI